MGKNAAILLLLICLVCPAAMGWEQKVVAGDIVYILFDSTPRIERYDLTTETWLSAIALTGTPTMMWVDDTYIFVAYDNEEVRRYDLDGTNENSFYTAPDNVYSIFSLDDKVYVHYYKIGSGVFVSFDRTTLTQVATTDVGYGNGVYGVVLAVNSKKVFGVAAFEDMVSFEVNSNGTIGTRTALDNEMAVTSTYPIWLSPDEQFVFGSFGAIHQTSDVTYAGALPCLIEDMEFYGNDAVVYREQIGSYYSYGPMLIRYDGATHLETGRLALDSRVQYIVVKDDTVYTFSQVYPDPIQVNKVSIADLQPVAPVVAVTPDELAYSPDQVIVGGDDIVYLLSKADRCVFRWSLSSREYLDTIPLTGAPEYIAHSTAHDRLYTAYEEPLSFGKIKAVDLGTQPFVEEEWFNLQAEPKALIASGSFLLFIRGLEEYGTLDADANYLDRAVDGWFTESPITTAYCESANRLYWITNTSPSDLEFVALDDTGTFTGPSYSSPYHDSSHWQLPLRVSPDGSRVLMGTGRFYDGTGLTTLNELGNEITDAVWHNGALYTLHKGADFTVQKWTGSDYGTLAGSETFGPGTASRLFDTSQGLLAVYQYAGISRLLLLDDDLQIAAGDDDGDGIQTAVEGTADSDGDGIPDFVDTDSDNDGLSDARESAVDDVDNDGLVGYLDSDSDNDGVEDGLEAQVGTDPNDASDFPVLPVAVTPLIVLMLAALIVLLRRHSRKAC